MKQNWKRRKKNQDAINAAKRRNLEVIQALQAGVEDELTNLRTDWMKLKDFYSKMNVFAAKATENSNRNFCFQFNISLTENHIKHLF